MQLVRAGEGEIWPKSQTCRATPPWVSEAVALVPTASVFQVRPHLLGNGECPHLAHWHFRDTSRGAVGLWCRAHRTHQPVADALRGWHTTWMLQVRIFHAHRGI